MMKEAKIIQSRLSRKGVTISLAQIREYVASNHAGTEADLTEERISEIVQELSESTAILLASKSELSERQKQSFIEQTASSLDINLSLEEIKGISQKMDWALNDRASLKKRVQDGIIAWVDYQIKQDKQQTDNMMREVEEHLVTRLQETNEHFNNSARQFSGRVGDAIEKFRATEEKILGLFKIPG